jgi:hypothetical protein
LEVSSVGIKGKAGANKSKMHDKYFDKLGTAGREVFTQFLIRIYFEIPGCKIAEFSKLKTLNGAAFNIFRKYFTAKLEKCFVVPANTFDNVPGKFPVGFKIWDTDIKEIFQEILTDTFDASGVFIKNKTFFTGDRYIVINKWISSFRSNTENTIGFLAGTNGNDFQQNNIVYILNKKEQMANPRGCWITKENLIESCIYFAVRHCIVADWLNDRDQFLYPNEGWERDSEFKTDCLTYTLFNNNIQSKYGTNHWIPFTEQEVNAHDKFESNFMTHFISGKKTNLGGGGGGGSFARQMNMFMVFEPEVEYQLKPMKFSTEAEEVFDAGRELWKYYHAVACRDVARAGAGGRDVARHVSTNGTYNVNASLYDIREYFQGRNESGKMNNTSEDTQYTELIGILRDKLKILAKKIEPKVYEYGFLKK